jgi:hypothetical protein
MELGQLVREIHWIEWQLRSFEDKYGILSKDSYEAMESGQLSEFDDGESPQFADFLEWHGLYRVWLSREQSYHDLLQRQSLPAQLRRATAVA